MPRTNAFTWSSWPVLRGTLEISFPGRDVLRVHFAHHQRIKGLIQLLNVPPSYQVDALSASSRCPLQRRPAVLHFAALGIASASACGTLGMLTMPLFLAGAVGELHFVREIV